MAINTEEDAARQRQQEAERQARLQRVAEQQAAQEAADAAGTEFVEAPPPPQPSVNPPTPSQINRFNEAEVRSQIESGSDTGAIFTERDRGPEAIEPIAPGITVRGGQITGTVRKDIVLSQLINNGATAEELAEYLRRNPDAIDAANSWAPEVIDAVNAALQGKGSSIRVGATQGFVQSNLTNLRLTDPLLFTAWREDGLEGFYRVLTDRVSRQQDVSKYRGQANKDIEAFAFDNQVPLYGLTTGRQLKPDEWNATLNGLITAGLDPDVLVVGGYIDYTSARQIKAQIANGVDPGEAISAAAFQSQGGNLATQMIFDEWQRSNQETKVKALASLKPYASSYGDYNETGLVGANIDISRYIYDSEDKQNAFRTLARAGFDAQQIQAANDYANKLELLEPYRKVYIKSLGYATYDLFDAVQDADPLRNRKPEWTNAQYIELQDAIETVFPEWAVNKTLQATQEYDRGLFYFDQADKPSAWKQITQAIQDGEVNAPPEVLTASAWAASTPFPQDDAAMKFVLGLFGVAAAVGVAVKAIDNNSTVSQVAKDTFVFTPQGETYTVDYLARNPDVAQEIDLANSTIASVDPESVTATPITNIQQTFSPANKIQISGFREQQLVELPKHGGNADRLRAELETLPFNQLPNIPQESLTLEPNGETGSIDIIPRIPEADGTLVHKPGVSKPAIDNILMATRVLVQERTQWETTQRLLEGARFWNDFERMMAEYQRQQEAEGESSSGAVRREYLEKLEQWRDAWRQYIESLDPQPQRGRLTDEELSTMAATVLSRELGVDLKMGTAEPLTVTTPEVLRELARAIIDGDIKIAMGSRTGEITGVEGVTQTGIQSGELTIGKTGIVEGTRLAESVSTQPRTITQPQTQQITQAAELTQTGELTRTGELKRTAELAAEATMTRIFPRKNASDKKKRAFIAATPGAVTWNQGKLKDRNGNLQDVWYVRVPPYTKDKTLIVRGSPPVGAEDFDGPGSAYKTLTARGARLPKGGFTQNLGAVRARITPGGPKGARIAFQNEGSDTITEHPDGISEREPVDITRHVNRISKKKPVRISPNRPRLRK